MIVFQKSKLMNILNICLITIIYGMANVSFSQSLQVPGDYHWKNRVLLIFSSNLDDKYGQQIDVFEEYQAGLKERDLVVFYIGDKEVKAPDNKTYAAKEVQQLRKQYQVADDAFSVILIGKDGTQKIMQGEVLDAGKLFAVIDAMPMRRREMREDGNP